METKVCSCCKMEKSVDDFSPRKPRKSSYKDGRDYQCRQCKNAKGTHKKKYKQDVPGLTKVENTEKHYIDAKGKLYIKLRIGIKKVKAKKIVVARKEYNTEKILRNYNMNCLYFNFGSKRAKTKAKLRIEYDTLWDKFCSLESLICNEAFSIIHRINQIEYLVV